MSGVKKSLDGVLVNNNGSVEAVLLLVEDGIGEQQIGDFFVEGTQHCLRVLVHSSIDYFGVFDLVHVQ